MDSRTDAIAWLDAYCKPMLGALPKGVEPTPEAARSVVLSTFVNRLQSQCGGVWSSLDLPRAQLSCLLVLHSLYEGPLPSVVATLAAPEAEAAHSSRLRRRATDVCVTALLLALGASPFRLPQTVAVALVRGLRTQQIETVQRFLMTIDALIASRPPEPDASAAAIKHLPLLDVAVLTRGTTASTGAPWSSSQSQFGGVSRGPALVGSGSAPRAASVPGPRAGIDDTVVAPPTKPLLQRLAILRPAISPAVPSSGPATDTDAAAPPPPVAAAAASSTTSATEGQGHDVADGGGSAGGGAGAAGQQGKHGSRWTEDEDDLLYRVVQDVGPNWTQVATRMVDRTPRQCADRWRRFGDLLELEKQGKITRDKRRRIGVFTDAATGMPAVSTAAGHGVINRQDFEETLRHAASSALARKPA